MSDASIAAGEAQLQPFTAEVSRLLHLMVHSVYSNRDIFLRELISNAADACERLRLMALQRPALLGGEPDFRITISADAEAKLLTIEDNGVGMDRAALIENLGTIARSGTRAFLDAAGDKTSGTALIGQFGVGFYSAFMVADEVEVFSRPAGSDDAWRWVSDGKGSFAVGPVDLAAAPARGTRVVLHLSAEGAVYTDPDTIERIVTEHSAHVPVPIVLRVDDTTSRSLADGSALWRKPKASIDKKAYAEFYNHVSGQYDEPALTLHFRAEGRHEYAALLFVPSAKPFDLFDPERKSRIKLYVRRVYITDEAKILPAWLRFVRGVIDSEDLPLNLSREMLQSNPVLTQIGKGVTTRLLAELDKLAKDDPDSFLKVWEAFGPVLKEGLYEEPERRDALFGLARFRTSTSGDAWRSLADYVAAMKPNQTSIFYAVGESRETIAASPHLEGFRRRGIEVLLLADAVDAFWVRTAIGFEGKSFKSITQGDADLSAIPVEGETPKAGEAAAPKAAVATLAARIKQALGDRVTAVRGSDRLTDSPVCLVAPESGPDRQFERILSAHQASGKRQAPVLELNPGHRLIKSLIDRATTGDGEIVDDAAIVLLGQARIMDGEQPDDAPDFARRLTRLLEARLG
ncbi:MAG: molecular chaperone HtpG [Bauldia sp.]